MHFHVVCRLNMTEHSRSSVPRATSRLSALIYQTSALRSPGTYLVPLCLNSYTRSQTRSTLLGRTFCLNVSVTVVTRLSSDKRLLKMVFLCSICLKSNVGAVYISSNKQIIWHDVNINLFKKNQASSGMFYLNPPHTTFIPDVGLISP